MALSARDSQHPNLSFLLLLSPQPAGPASIRLLLGTSSAPSVLRTATRTRREPCTATVRKTTSVRKRTPSRWPALVRAANLHKYIFSRFYRFDFTFKPPIVSVWPTLDFLTAWNSGCNIDFFLKFCDFSSFRVMNVQVKFQYIDLFRKGWTSRRFDRCVLKKKKNFIVAFKG